MLGGVHGLQQSWTGFQPPGTPWLSSEAQGTSRTTIHGRHTSTRWDGNKQMKREKPALL